MMLKTVRMNRSWKDKTNPRVKRMKVGGAMPHILGERVMLREYREEDFPAIRAWVNDPETTRYLSGAFLAPHTALQTEQYMQNILAGKADGYHFIVARREDGAYLGQIDFLFVHPVNRYAELGMVLARAAERGQGYGREALSLMLGFGFESLNLHRIGLEVFAENERAVRCYEACGFVREGVLRAQEFSRGAYRDILRMAVLREEWEAHPHPRSGIR